MRFLWREGAIRRAFFHSQVSQTDSVLSAFRKLSWCIGQGIRLKLSVPGIASPYPFADGSGTESILAALGRPR